MTTALAIYFTIGYGFFWVALTSNYLDAEPLTTRIAAPLWLMSLWPLVLSMALIDLILEKRERRQ